MGYKEGRVFMSEMNFAYADEHYANEISPVSVLANRLRRDRPRRAWGSNIDDEIASVNVINAPASAPASAPVSAPASLSRPPPSQETIYIVTVPFNKRPGSNMEVTTPGGGIYAVTVPPGAFPGGTFKISVKNEHETEFNKWKRRVFKIQEVVFENSKDIPDGLYKKLMDALVIN